MDPTFDILIRHGRVLDGTGNPWYYADVGIRGDRIAAVGSLPEATAAREIDATGHFVCPGFIDLHTHSDLMLLTQPTAEAKIMQGVTTEVIGHDGLSYAPVNEEALAFFRRVCAAINGNPDLDYNWRSVGEFLARFDGQVSPNVAFLLPHGPVRMTAMGGADRRPTEGEVKRMLALVEEGMREGAVGFSTGLSYAPCSYADAEELIALCRRSARYGGFFAPHLRSYGKTVLESIREALDICERSGCPLHLTHYQAVFPVNEHKAPVFAALVEEARGRGLQVTTDSYPYAAGSTYILGFFPTWVQALETPQWMELLTDPQEREKLRIAVEVEGCDGSHGVPIDWSKAQISGVGEKVGAEWIGRRVADVARELGQTTFDLVCDLLRANEGRVSCVYFGGYEPAVRFLSRPPWHAVGSDGILVGDQPHPRGWGCFARFLGRYVRELGLLTWEEAVRQMTGFAAQVLGLPDRGLLKPGFAADLTLFDPATVLDTATFEEPRQYPQGIPYVIVNGQLVKDQGIHTGARPGRVLRRG